MQISTQVHAVQAEIDIIGMDHPRKRKYDDT
jgi:hypothetical protein